MRRGMMGAVMVLALVLAGCGSAPEPKPETPEEPPPEATRPPAVTRAELSKRIEEVGRIHQEAISVLQKVKEAQTSQWARTRAGEAVQTAKMMRDQAARLLRRQLEEAKDSHLERVSVRIATRKRTAETALSRARFKLKAAQ